ncbi:MAG: response regulator [Betaproteobacteria bacterium]|nr:response regulator [Betaproteobacteria bacterium]
MKWPDTAGPWPPWLSRFPKGFREGKRPYVFLFALLMIALLLAFALIGRDPQAWQGYLPMAALLGLLMLAIEKGLPLAPAVHTATAAGAVVLLSAIWHSGGVFSPRLAWLMLLPLTPFYVMGARAGTLWAVLTLAMQLGMALATARGWVPLFDAKDQNLASSWLTFSMVTAVLIIVPLLYERHNQRAMRESREHQRALELQRQELERTLRMRELFMSTVSHELRTPMNAILGFNALLMSRVQNKPQALQVLQHTSQSAEHLMTVINDILDYSQLQTGQLEIHPDTFELRHVVQQALDLFLPRVQGGKVDLRIALDPGLPNWVHTDRHRLMQVLVNLLGNALKFTHQGEVVLSVRWLDPGVHFEVRDTGIGIAQEQQSRIFSRFNQADSDIQARYGGNGLGLAISRQLVQLLHGEMGFESVLGEGSRFWLRLPLSPCAAPQRRTKVRPEVHTANFPWRFLLVDDHAINRLLAQQVLRGAWPKAEIVEAADGQQALDRLAEGGFDLVLMDMVMPGMDGIVATQRLRSTLPAPAKHVPVLGLTANVNPSDLDAFQRAGLSGLMLKPFEPATLCARIEQLLLQRSA